MTFSRLATCTTRDDPCQTVIEDHSRTHLLRLTCAHGRERGAHERLLMDAYPLVVME